MTGFDRVVVFSATKAREREGLGERVTAFLDDYDGEVVDVAIRQSSDREYHCVTIILFGRKRKRRRENGRNQDGEKHC